MGHLQYVFDKTPKSENKGGPTTPNFKAKCKTTEVTLAKKDISFFAHYSTSEHTS